MRRSQALRGIETIQGVIPQSTSGDHEGSQRGSAPFQCIRALVVRTHNQRIATLRLCSWNDPCLERGVTTPIEEWPMLDKTTMKFSHVKPGDTDFKGEGLRDFFFYRDLGIAEATTGKVLAQLVRSNNAPEKGTGWHYHGADFHVVYMLKGWARFMYEDKETLVEAGDCVHQRPGIVHFLFDYSPDMEYLEVVGPADFTTIETVGPCPVPEPTPWK
jgi:quercetin dioxygenase-like cupin family protein